MSETAKIILDGKEYEFPIVTGSEGEKAIDIGKLRDTTGYITLKAAADAPAISQQLAPINVHVSINFVMKHTFCERPIKITVVR